MRFLSVVCVAFAVAMAASGCARKIATVGCETTRDCDAGDICSAGQCIAGPTLGGTGIEDDGCANDIDCGAGFVCADGSCKARSAAGSRCTGIADCPLDQYCNVQSGQCEALREEWCRDPSQCEAPKGICSAANNTALGRCLACQVDTDCSGAGEVCTDFVCSASGSCPQNATMGATGCTCNTGFTLQGTTCVSNTPNNPGGGGNPGGGSNPGGGQCTVDDDCFAGGNFNFSCDNGSCACDALLLALQCVISGLDTDLAGCVCVETPVENPPPPPPPGGALCEQLSDCARDECDGVGFCTELCENGIDDDADGNADCADLYCQQRSVCSGNPPPPPPPPPTTIAAGTNDLCDFDFECPGVLLCIDDDDTDMLKGACKVGCVADTDCSSAGPGFACLGDPFGASTRGFCAETRDIGFTCQGDVVVNWWSQNQLCEGGGCFSGICETICDYAGNTGAAFACPAGEACGALLSRVEYGIDVAVCQ
jgi:hypothetical protein